MLSKLRRLDAAGDVNAQLERKLRMGNVPIKDLIFNYAFLFLRVEIERGSFVVDAGRSLYLHSLSAVK